MARLWASQGHKVTLLCSQAYFPEEQRQKEPIVYEQEGVEIHALDVSYDHHFSFFKRARAFFRFYAKGLAYAFTKLEKPDFILAYTAPLFVAWLGQRLASRFDVPWILEIADVWPDVPIEMGLIPHGPWRPFLRVRTRNAYDSANGIITFSPGMKDLILAQGVPSTKVEVSYNGTLMDNWPEIDRNRPESQPVELLYAGTIGLANDLSQLLHAMDILEKMEDLPAYRLTILGVGNDLTMVRDEGKRLQLKKVRFLQRVNREELPELFQAADIGLVSFAPYPILATNSATKFFDYMAAGLPVVINYQGWQAQVLQDANAGLSTPQGDYVALASNIARLIKDSHLRQEMGKNARQYAEKHFDRNDLSVQMWAQMMAFIDPAKP
ncbi:MAG: glycosyltransferase family 4 protein [Bacteroidia bacterium]|nr:glycosyltransferase family 4 protein [Bacteroidia bacterium]